MKKVNIFIIFILLFYSFSFAEIPYKAVALRIYKIPYDKHTYNCLWKSEMYCEYLKSKGIEAKIVIGRFRKEKFYRHAWIEYFDGKDWRIIDLTAKPKEWGYKKQYYNWLKEIK